MLWNTLDEGGRQGLKSGIMDETPRLDPEDTITQRYLENLPKPVKVIDRSGGAAADGTHYRFNPSTQSLQKVGPDGKFLKRFRMSKKERRALKKHFQSQKPNP